jgi:hypothetical protein
MDPNTPAPGGDEPTQPSVPQQPAAPPPIPAAPPRPFLQQAQARAQGPWDAFKARLRQTFPQSAGQWSTSKPRTKVIVGVLAGVVSLCAVCSCCTIALAAANGGGATTGAPITQRSTNAPKGPTATPKPTNTAGPTATATKPPTPEQQIQALVAAQLKKDGQKTDGLKVTIDSDRIVTVEHDASDNLTGDFIKIGIQLDAFSVMKAIWTQWPANLGAKPSQVTFKDMGDTKDKYGNNSRGAWGTAVLYAETAALFNWSGLDRESAWNAYDVKYYISGL